MTRYDFLLDTYRTERLKTLSVWSQVPDARMHFRPEPRARSPLEHMVHQCVSEDTWMRTMLGIAVGGAALPHLETRLAFMEHYAAVSVERLTALETKADTWWEEETDFFEVRRSRAWVMTRRLTHSAHHRAQLTVYLRLFGQALYSTYGPTADTGGLFQDHAPVIYRYQSIPELLEGERAGGVSPALPGPGSHPPTERPEERVEELDRNRTIERHLLDEALLQMRKLKAQADTAIAQVNDRQLFTTLDAEANSIALIMKHLAGNMRSRWTDFLTSDGEKPDRERDKEFLTQAGDTRAGIAEAWEDGWRRTFDAVSRLAPGDVQKTVMIRGEPHTVLEAISRQLTHYAAHIGQIVLLAKHLAGAGWRTLSIPRGMSNEFTASKEVRGDVRGDSIRPKGL